MIERFSKQKIINVDVLVEQMKKNKLRNNNGIRNIRMTQTQMGMNCKEDKMFDWN